MIFLISYCDKGGSIRTHRTNNSSKAYDFAMASSRPTNITVWMDTQIPNYSVPRNFICESKDAISSVFATIIAGHVKELVV